MLSPAAKKLLEDAMKKLGLSGRSLNKVLKVARTISDLCFSEEIKEEHLLEALSYRALDRYKFY
jgi:magnesium chelatase family protein